VSNDMKLIMENWRKSVKEGPFRRGQPDDSRTGTALDFLDVDDDISKIVDDPIENSFLAALGKTLDSLPDDRSLEDINVTKELQAYIARNFNKKSVASDVNVQSSIS